MIQHQRLCEKIVVCRHGRQQMRYHRSRISIRLWDLLGIDPSTDFENKTIPSGTQWRIDDRHMAHELSAATRRQTAICAWQKWVLGIVLN
jgi:hypothetical protein